jgi:hypothetical protein
VTELINSLSELKMELPVGVKTLIGNSYQLEIDFASRLLKSFLYNSIKFSI